MADCDDPNGPEDDSEQEEEKETEKVGYKSPPKRTRFQPGKSGNPRGRPRGVRGLKAELLAEISQIVSVTENGKTIRVNKLRLTLKALAAKAAKGNVAAADKLLNLVIQTLGFEDQRTERSKLSDTDQLILDQLLNGNDPEPSPSDPEPPADDDEEETGA